MKISNQLLASTLTGNINTLKSSIGERQLHISSNKKYVSRSDNPIDSSNAARVKRIQKQNEQWSRNLDAAMHWTKVTEGMLTEGVNNLQRARELTVKAKDSTITAEDRIIIGKEINSILEQVLMISNTTQGDGYLFAGTDSANIPFTETRDATGKITSIATSGNPSNQRSIQADSNVTITYGRAATGSTGAFINSTSGVNVFATLISLRDDLLAGNTPPGNTLTNIEGTLNNTVSALVSSGVDHKRFDNLTKHYNNIGTALTDELNLLENADLPAEITNLSQLQVSLQASMQMAARLSDFTLSNYI